jgi:hypothetical protein
MKLEGRIWKSRASKHWLAEVRDLDLVTQGTSRKDAATMLADAIESLVNHDDFRVRVKVGKRGACSVGSNDDVRLAALTLRRLRGRGARQRSGRRRAA